MIDSVGGIQVQVRVTGLAAINDVIANLTGAGANLRPVMRDAATCRRDESLLRPHINFRPLRDGGIALISGKTMPVTKTMQKRIATAVRS